MQVPKSDVPQPKLDFVSEYWIDAWQRWLLSLDVLRQRGNTYVERAAADAPHVLSFGAELVIDGRTLERPVNYVLAFIPPADGAAFDPAKRPFIVVDPRAGHGPGIGGMKQESEIGMVLKAGHPCYFIGFLPEPVDGQTIEDICLAEANFVAEVARRHPKADGKPALIGNCQAGWQTMISAAMEPELFGPIVLAGSPLAYWEGAHGLNPMRYTGGVLGGTWLTALAGDLGGGRFDGANLVANFESLNPANTYWQKPYGVYSRIDTEADRFLDFETWWGSPVLLNAEEMQWIADNLFVGNKLATGGVRMSNGAAIDLRRITSPIVVFSSWGDNITPPQQALGWIPDLYSTDSEIVACGQTIVYSTHQSIGHLGIFVSGKIATREHSEFVTCMDMIDLMPPGLYEAVISEADGESEGRELIEGRYLFRLEPRTLADIRALGGNDEADDKRFSTAARVSEINLGLYRRFAQPAVRAAVNTQLAEASRQLHPSRLRFAAFSDRNPLMAPVKALAEQARADRKPVSSDNPLLAVEQIASSWMTTWLDSYRIARDAATEALFQVAYGSPLLQAAVGVTAGTTAGTQAAPHVADDLEPAFESGGLPEAMVRALVYVRAESGSADERGFGMVMALRAVRPAAQRLDLADLKRIVRTQFLLVHRDEERALATLPKLLPDNDADRLAAFDIVRRIVSAKGEPSGEDAKRLRRIASLFGADAKP